MKKDVKRSLLLTVICFLLLITVSTKTAAADESMLTTQFIGNNCVITQCNPSAEGELIIPSEISGIPVTHIAEKAFYMCDKLTEIILPDTVKEIGSEAFYGCSKLRRLTMTDSVQVIGQRTFYKCSSLEETVLSDSLISIPKDAFYMCSSLAGINIPAQTKAIGENAFFGCNSLKNIVLPEKVIHISTRCFSNCTSLESVCLPSGLEIIGTDAFEKCSSLSAVYYIGDSNAFKEIDVSSGNSLLETAEFKFSHNHISQAEIITFKADCTHDGYSLYTYSCGFVSEGEHIPASGHKLELFKTEEEAGCTKKGSAIFSCLYCDYRESRSTPEKGHSIVTDNAVKATCTTPGKTKGSHCSRCNLVIEKQNQVSPLGHDFTLKLKDKKHLASKATYRKASKYFYSCSRCKNISTDKTFSGEKLVLSKVKKLDFTATTTSVTLKWKAVSSARGYAVYKKDSKGKWSLIKRVRTNSFKINKLSAGAVNNYAVRAYVIEGEKIIYAPEYTPIKVATKPLPTSKISAKQNEKSITLSWKKSKGATGYRVYRYDTKKKKWVIISSYTKSNKLTVKKLDSGRAYKFCVRSCVDTGNKLVWSNRSESIVTCTKPSKPVVKSTAYKYAIKLDWNKVKYADGYTVYVSSEPNSGYKKVKTTKKTSCKIEKLKNKKTYYFKIYAYRKLSDGNVYSYASQIKKVNTR